MTNKKTIRPYPEHRNPRLQRQERRESCKQYIDCLNYAVASDWEGFSCADNCTGYVYSDQYRDDIVCSALYRGDDFATYPDEPGPNGRATSFGKAVRKKEQELIAQGKLAPISRNPNDRFYARENFNEK